jgi:hypothetical protein
MKLVRVLWRIALISLTAAVFVGLTAIYGDSVRPPLPYPRFQAAHRHPPPTPNLGEFAELIASGIALTLFAAGGRIALRLRLNPASPSEERAILLGLHGQARTLQGVSDFSPGRE